MDYELTAKVFKALGDPKRVQIVDKVSCGERCACDLLEHFEFTQPTHSHHMKVLMNAGIVQARKSFKKSFKTQMTVFVIRLIMLHVLVRVKGE